MKKVSPTRCHLLRPHRNIIPMLLLFFLLAGSPPPPANTLLRATTMIGEAAGVADQLNGRAVSGQQSVVGLSGSDEKTRDRDETEGGRGKRGAEVNLLATQSLSRELVIEEQQNDKGNGEVELMNIQLRSDRKRFRRGNKEPADVDREEQTHHVNDEAVEDDIDIHHKDTSDKEHQDDHAHSWKYYGVYGPSNWSLVAPDCSSDRPRQTPIDIQTTRTELDETMSEISMTVSDPRPDEKVTMVNNGHTVNVVFDNTIRVGGGKLGNVFRVAGVHFHWGASDYTGSEHTINEKRFPLEMHIVSYDEQRFSDVSETLTSSSDSLAVLGVLFTISEDDNPLIEPIVSNLMTIQIPATSTSIPYFDLRTLLPPKYETHFYRYFGSLTTPPCSEVVIWTVFKHPQNISHAQVARFRELYEAKPHDDDDYPTYLRHNWRPLQPIHGRTVARSFLHLPRRNPPRPRPPAAHDHLPAAVAAVAEQSAVTACNCQRQSSSSVPLIHYRRSAFATILHSLFALLALILIHSTP